LLLFYTTAYAIAIIPPVRGALDLAVITSHGRRSSKMAFMR